MQTKPPPPPFTPETAARKLRLAEGAVRTHIRGSPSWGSECAHRFVNELGLLASGRSVREIGAQMRHRLVDLPVSRARAETGH